MTFRVVKATMAYYLGFDDVALRNFLSSAGRECYIVLQDSTNRYSDRCCCLALVVIQIGKTTCKIAQGAITRDIALHA